MATEYKLKSPEGKTFPMIFPTREAAERHSTGTDLTVTEHTIPEWKQKSR